MNDTRAVELNERELQQEIPDWIPGRTEDPTQLKMFVHWVCRIHYGAAENRLTKSMHLGKRSPFNRVLEGLSLQRACFELAVHLGRVLKIPDLQTEDLTNKLVLLQRLDVTKGEYGDWHRLAETLRQTWLRGNAKSEGE